MDAAVAEFQEVALRLHERTHEPYPLCSEVCDQRRPPVCLYRHYVAGLFPDQRIENRWTEATNRFADAAFSDLEAARQRGSQQWEVSKSAAYQLIDDATSSATGRAAWCFAQQQTFADPFVPPKDRLNSLLWIREAAKSDNFS